MKRYPPLERAITYIEAHLNEYIGLNEVSRETGYSYLLHDPPVFFCFR